MNILRCPSISPNSIHVSYHGQYRNLDFKLPIIRSSWYSNEFQELTELGKGGFGSVYRVKRREDGIQFAIKKVHLKLDVKTGRVLLRNKEELDFVENERKKNLLLGNLLRLESQQKNDYLVENLVERSENLVDEVVPCEEDELEVDLDVQREFREPSIMSYVCNHKNVVGFYRAWLEPADLESAQNLMDDSSENLTGWETPKEDTLPFINNSLALELSMPISTPYDNTSNTTITTTKPSPMIIHTKKQNFIKYSSQLTKIAHQSSLMKSEIVSFSDDLKSESVKMSNSSLISNLPEQLTKWGDSGSVSAFYSSQTGIKDDFNQAKPESEEDFQKNKDQKFKEKSGQLNFIMFIQMQLCGEMTLKDWLDKNQTRGPECSSILQQILRGVNHIHHQGLIHRDLKPSNLFLKFNSEGLTVKIGDFGLSVFEDSAAPLSPNSIPITSHTNGVGTKFYASPEQLNGKPYDSKTDIFSIGMILFELYHPFSSSLMRFKKMTKLRDHCSIPQWVCIKYPEQVSWIKKMVNWVPSVRPTAEEILRGQLFRNVLT